MCEVHIDWLPPTRPQSQTWPTTQACTLTRNHTDNPLVCRAMPNPLSHTSQGSTHTVTQDIPRVSGALCPELEKKNRYALLIVSQSCYWIEVLVPDVLKCQHSECQGVE